MNTLEATGCSNYFAHIHLYIHAVTNLATFLPAGNDRRVGRLFCATVHCLMMGHLGPKHVGVCVEEHYGNSTEVRAFVGHILTVES